MNDHMAKQRILVGFSGGVDSAVTALLLRRQGHDVTAVTMRVEGPGIEGCANAGNAEAAERLANELALPFHAIDCSGAFADQVIADFRREYLSGRTPNPCVRCNPAVKFGALWHQAEASGLVFDKFATGHYARIDYAGPRLLRGVDPHKDQSYFLYRLSAEQLARTVFPLGTYHKTSVRELAREWGVPVHDQADSQDFFAGEYARLLDQPDREGEIVDSSGKVLGKHTGFWHFTIGQRKGICVPYREALYVIRIDAENNRVVVGTRSDQMSGGCVIGELSFPAGVPQAGTACLGKVRSAQPLRAMRVGEEHNGELAVEFAEPIQGVAPGQSLVLYDGKAVLGGGIIIWANQFSSKEARDLS